MLTERLVARIDAFMATHHWSHNAHYHRWISHSLPATITRALDVGCGTGDLVRVLARRATHVDGIDTDPSMIEHARAVTPQVGRITFTVASLLDLPADHRYDAVTAVAVIHHVPLAEGLQRLIGALAPGGTLVIVGCYREETRSDHALGLTAVAANVAVGAYRGQAVRPASMTAPVAPSTMTLAEIREVAEQVIPGFRLRRGLFWRYLLTWTP